MKTYEINVNLDDRILIIWPQCRGQCVCVCVREVGVVSCSEVEPYLQVPALDPWYPGPCRYHQIHTWYHQIHTWYHQIHTPQIGGLCIRSLPPSLSPSLSLSLPLYLSLSLSVLLPSLFHIDASNILVINLI